MNIENNRNQLPEVDKVAGPLLEVKRQEVKEAL